MINVKQKHVKILNTIIIRWIDIQEVVFFHAAIILSFFEVQNVNVTNGNVTNYDFLVVF